MTHKRKTNFFCLFLCLFVLMLDQATKLSITSFINAGTFINICPHFNVVLTFNAGTSFGLLAPNNLSEYYLIIILSILCIVFLFYIFIKSYNSTEKIMYAILIGGATSNLVDRFLHGAVVDFIDIYYKTWHWPAFNFADMFICCSAISLVGYNLFASQSSK